MNNHGSTDNAALETAFKSALSFLDNLDNTSVAATVDLETLRNRLGRPLTAQGVSAETVIKDLVRDVEGGLIGSAGGRFFGWAIGGSLSAANAADWLATVWDQNAALYSCSPAAAVTEEVVGLWLKELFGLPQAASFALVTGCQMAHVTCLAAARHALLQRLGWDVEEKGLYDAPRIRILTNNQRHGSVERAVRLLGIGKSSIVDVPTDSKGRILGDSLRDLLKDGDGPSIVLLQAGDFHTGSFDDFESLIPIARQFGAWVHIDGAFGIWVATSPKYSYLTRGLEMADSWAVDGHKWLNVPFDCGYALVGDAESHRGAMSHRAEYLTHDIEARDQIDWNPEWSRRARGFSTYAGLRQLGKEGVSDLIEHSCSHATSIVSSIGRLPGVEVMSEPIINQGVVRFLDLRAGATNEDHDRKTDEVIAKVAASGEAFFTAATWHGHRVMRVSVCNWRTSETDVRRSVDAFKKILEPSHIENVD